MSDLKLQIEKRLKELQHDCALKRLYLRQAFGPRWSGCARMDPDKPSSWDLHWENLQAEAQRQRPKDIAAADKKLADFITESRAIMGSDWPGTDHGRLCWSPFCGGMPIGQFYCELPEGHDGPHVGTEEYGRKTAWPNSPLQEVTNDRQWHELIKLCLHPTPTRREPDGATICSVCGMALAPGEAVTA